jgi:molybdate transport system substrate-binding protein
VICRKRKELDLNSRATVRLIRPLCNHRLLILLLATLTAFAVIHGSSLAGDKTQVTVFAAASTTNAITDIGKIFTRKHGGRFVPSFASSSTLAKQIAAGAPADVYVSANPKWMNFLEEKKLIEPGTRFNLLGNSLVLISPKDSRLNVKIEKNFPLANILGNEKLAMGDPDHVPAGIYGKKALVALEVWKSVEPKVARTKDVRAALVLVERAEAPLGVVYATDAAISKRVKVVAKFPSDVQPKIVYPVAIIKGHASPASKRFLELMRSPEAKQVFEHYGFRVLQ